MTAFAQPMISLADVTAAQWTAIGGVGAFVATAVLAFLAYRQMSTLASQAQAAEDQVKIMRQAAEEEAASVKKQIEASVAQGEAIREAARAQLAPIVFAHGADVHIGPENDYMLGEGQVGFGYRLGNEGTGVALNIRHGIEVAGRKIPWNDAAHWRALRPGVTYPPEDFIDPTTGAAIRVRPFVVVCDERELPEDYLTQPRHYWAEFDSVFGEPFRTQNPSAPDQPASLVRVFEPN